VSRGNRIELKHLGPDGTRDDDAVVAAVAFAVEKCHEHGLPLAHS
jgi:hypothetical protein